MKVLELEQKGVLDVDVSPIGPHKDGRLLHGFWLIDNSVFIIDNDFITINGSVFMRIKSLYSWENNNVYRYQVTEGLYGIPIAKVKNERFVQGALYGIIYLAIKFDPGHGRFIAGFLIDEEFDNDPGYSWSEGRMAFIPCDKANSEFAKYIPIEVYEKRLWNGILLFKKEEASKLENLLWKRFAEDIRAQWDPNIDGNTQEESPGDEKEAG